MPELYFPVIEQRDEKVFVWGTIVGPANATLREALDKIGKKWIGIYRLERCFYFAEGALDLTLAELRPDEILVVKD